MNTEEILIENERRERKFDEVYNQTTGEGCLGDRTRVATPVPDLPWALVPDGMRADPAYRPDMGATEWKKLRCRHDFEYWAATCAVIRDKMTGRDMNFVLNKAQREVLEVLERARQQGRPIRVLILKARQWGCSTLVQMYMAWMQTCVCRNWHSLICAHVKDTAATIRGMYSKLLANYPPELWDGDGEPGFKPFERSQNVREITGRGCHITLASSESPDAVRGFDFAMAHLSETAYWVATPTRPAGALIRNISGSVAMIPNSLVVMESTANGVGNYFHSEWLRCRAGQGDKEALFVPWHHIGIYRLTPPDPRGLVESFTAYEQRLWDIGLSLSQIWWHRNKLREYQDEKVMHSEFPTTAEEAFVNSGRGVFSAEAVERLRHEGCMEGARGDFSPVSQTFIPDSGGCAVMWKDVEPKRAYVVAVDIGGRTPSSDWSVIAVIGYGERPEVVAQWRGHLDHDLLAATAMTMARHYNEALLIVESNTLEGESTSGEGDLYVLNRLAREYPRMYRRRCPDSLTGRPTDRVGFHTNRQTKGMVISALIAQVREAGYIERDGEACNELLTYELGLNGSYGAKAGCHDDIVMTRAIGLYVMSVTPPPAMEGLKLPVVVSW